MNTEQRDKTTQASVTFRVVFNSREFLLYSSKTVSFRENKQQKPWSCISLSIERESTSRVANQLRKALFRGLNKVRFSLNQLPTVISTNGPCLMTV